MDLVYTIAQLAADFAGLSDLAAAITAWWEDRPALTEGADYQDVADFVASTTEAVLVW